MAHPNITPRRAAVERLLMEYGRLTVCDKHDLCAIFGCSSGAIHADVIALTRPKSRESAFPTPRIKRIVYERDGRICQYCGDGAARAYIIEHVLPVALGGVAQPYNLVVACGSCNTRKRRTVWLPLNFDTITIGHPEWRERVHTAVETRSDGNLSAGIRQMVRERDA